MSNYCAKKEKGNKKMKHKKTAVPKTQIETISENNKTKNSSHSIQSVNVNPVQEKQMKISPVQSAVPPSTNNIPENKRELPKALAKNPVLFMKSGATDLRRGVKQLGEITKNQMGQDPLDGNMHAFANKPKTTIKIVQKKEDGLALYTKYVIKPADWPGHQPPDKPGHIVTLAGKEKDNLLKKLGCPKEL
jgi:hypothetical protein